MNEKEFWNAETAQNFLDRTKGKFLKKVICTAVAAVLLGMLLLVGTVTDGSTSTMEAVYLFGGLGALLVSGAVFTLAKVSSKVLKWTLLVIPILPFNFVLAITFGGTLFCGGLLLAVIPTAVDMLLLLSRRMKAKQYIQV